MSNLWDYRPVVWDYRESTWTMDGDLIGYGVAASDGDVGTIAQATTGAAGAYVVVDLGSGASSGKRVIPAGAVTALDHAVRLVRLSLTRSDVRDAPAFEPDRWGEDDRTQNCLKYLARYGTHAKALLPKLQEHRTYLATVKKRPAKKMEEVDKLIAAIEFATSTPTLVSLDDFKAKPSAQ